MIALVTKERIMPPWPADPAYSHFLNERVLSQEQIDLISRWVESGMPEGKKEDLPPIPDFKKDSADRPYDLLVKMPEPVKLKGNAQDHFFVMKLPFEVKSDTFIERIEFVPHNRKLVHHVNAHLILYKENAKKNIYAGEWILPQDSFDAGTKHKALQLQNDDGSYPLLIPSVINYLPGVYPLKYPEGVGGYPLTKKAALYINDMHYGGTPEDQIDNSYFKIWFSSKKPERPLQEFQIGTLGIAKTVPELKIPADSVKKFRADLRINQDISLLTIVPHMHMIGKSFLAYAIPPKGDTIPLIRIKQWDFRWQYFYTFEKMLKIPAGSVIHAEGIYDNTSDNPNNPFNPPRMIEERSGSMRTTDEMFQLIVTYLPYRNGDENISLSSGK